MGNGGGVKKIKKILGVKATYVDREQTNSEIIRKVNEEVKKLTPKRQTLKQVKPFDRMYEERRQKLFNEIINQVEEESSRSVTLKNTIKPIDVTERPGTKRRSGKPTIKWVETGRTNYGN